MGWVGVNVRRRTRHVMSRQAASVALMWLWERAVCGMRLVASRGSALAGILMLVASCSGGSQHRPPDPLCTGVAERGPGSWAGADSVGFAKQPGSVVTVRESFTSTAAVMNRWDVGRQLEPLVAEWPSLSPGQAVTACWLDGAFSSRDGRVFKGALVETSGGASRLILAGTSAQPLRVVEPPTS